jgi:U3 small nucleolar RNA-associated protein 23
LVATQDAELKKYLRQIPGIPLIHICHNAITLENPSKVSRQRADEVSRTDSHLSSLERETLERLNSTMPQMEERAKRKRYRPQGPNPLSVKRKKTQVPPKKSSKGKKTRRKPKRSSKASQVE